jgi:hypothetical protein
MQQFIINLCGTVFFGIGRRVPRRVIRNGRRERPPTRRSRMSRLASNSEQIDCLLVLRPVLSPKRLAGSYGCHKTFIFSPAAIR